jgi:methyl-accepting chemotaxis protein
MLSGDTARSRLGLRSKIIAALAAQTIITAVLIIGIEQWSVRRAIRQLTIGQGEAIARTIGYTAGYYVLFGLNDDLRKVINDLRQSPAVTYADFVSADGTVLASSAAAPPIKIASSAGRTDYVSPSGEDLHLFVVPFTEAGTAKGYFRLLMNEREGSAAARAMRWTNLAATLLVLLLAVPMAWLASRMLVRPILDLAVTANTIAKGDLTQRTAVESDDEIGSLAEAFNTMATNLEKTVTKLVGSETQLKSVAETVGSRSRTVVDRVDEQRAIIDDMYHTIDSLNAGVRKITENVEELSAASEETSSSMLEMVASMEEVTRHTDTLWRAVEETASATNEMVTSINEVDSNVDYLTRFVTDTSSSMVEMSASIAQVEGNAARSYDLALGVATAAESGMEAVRQTIEGMEEIRHAVSDSNEVVARLGDRSVAINKIVSVIDDIAEQTNLLALNAAILAAQAGEHGRGFSVVAAEIRELSERTAASTREIAGLIRSVQAEVSNALSTMAEGTRLVERGVGLSKDAGRALENILESSGNASAMGREIASATRQQAEGSEAVTRSVTKLQELVRQINSATTQQAQGSDHILKAVESMREVTQYVRQAMQEQKTGSTMISAATDRMIEMIHDIFSIAASQAGESGKIVATMEQMRTIAEGNRSSANEMSDSLTLLSEAIRGLHDEVRRFRVRG